MTKSALVTGANKGIGLETVRQLAGKGWKAVLELAMQKKASKQ